MGKGKGLADHVAEYVIGCRAREFACLNVNEIARRFEVSVPHLSRTFRADKGVGLHDFIFREKILRSRFLLIQQSDMAVKDVAAVLDICSTDYFIRVFKERFGVTPGQCRRIDGAFQGVRDRRVGSGDRRGGPRDRRSAEGCGDSPGIRASTRLEIGPIKHDRRRGTADRRHGPADRRGRF